MSADARRPPRQASLFGEGEGEPEAPSAPHAEPEAPSARPEPEATPAAGEAAPREPAEPDPTPAAAAATAERAPAVAAAPAEDELPLRPDEPAPTPVPSRDGPGPAALAARVYAGAADLLVHGAVLALVLGLLRALGATPALADLPALVALFVVFSLFYTVVSLAFWGRTPGMAAAGLVARGLGGEPLTFGQAARRWLAGCVTVLAVGLPALVALSGRSLADRWSGSVVRERP